jgi:hypothetical protein
MEANYSSSTQRRHRRILERPAEDCFHVHLEYRGELGRRNVLRCRRFRWCTRASDLPIVAAN